MSLATSNMTRNAPPQPPARYGPPPPFSPMKLALAPPAPWQGAAYAQAAYAQAAYAQAAWPGAPAWPAQQAAAWGPEAALPRVDMQVLSDAKPREAGPEKKDSEVRVAFTSAEDLADALFPMDRGERALQQQQLEELKAHNEMVHHALLDHKEAMEGMDAHRGAVRDALQDQDKTIQAIQHSLAEKDAGLVNHRETLEQMAADSKRTQAQVSAQGAEMQQLRATMQDLKATADSSHRKISKLAAVDTKAQVAELAQNVLRLESDSKKTRQVLVSHTDHLRKHASDAQSMKTAQEAINKTHTSSVASLSKSLAAAARKTDSTVQGLQETVLASQRDIAAVRAAPAQQPVHLEAPRRAPARR